MREVSKQFQVRKIQFRESKKERYTHIYREVVSRERKGDGHFERKVASRGGFESGRLQRLFRDRQTERGERNTKREKASMSMGANSVNGNNTRSSTARTFNFTSWSIPRASCT